MVHGFTALVLENPFFGNGMRQAPERARAFLTRMLRLARSAFETPATDEPAKMRARATAAAASRTAHAATQRVASLAPKTKRQTSSRRSVKQPTSN